MRNIPQNLLDELKKGYYRPATLINIEDTLVFTDWSSPLFYDGILYYPRGMRTTAIRTGANNIVDNFSFEIDDVNREIFSSLTNTLTDNNVYNQYLVVMDKDQQIVASSLIYNGFVDSWEYAPSVMRIDIVSIFIQWNRETTKYFSSSCRWQKFKGNECGYTNENDDICDRSYSQCLTYNNADNFGGFRWLPTLVDKRLRIGDSKDDPKEQ